MSDDATEPGPNELQCPDCESIISRSEDFCPECGVSLYREKTGRAERSIDFSAAPDDARTRWVLAGLLVLVLALLLAAAGYVYLYGVPSCQPCPPLPSPVDTLSPPVDTLSNP